MPKTKPCHLCWTQGWGRHVCKGKETKPFRFEQQQTPTSGVLLLSSGLGDGSRPRPSGASLSSGFTQSRKSPSSTEKKKKKRPGLPYQTSIAVLPTGERPRGESERKLFDRSLLACVYPRGPYRELQNLLVQSFRRFETSPGLCRGSRFAKSFGGGGARRRALLSVWP